MSNKTYLFRAIQKPEGVSSCYSLVIVDGDGRPHLPLTRFYYETQQILSDGATRTYLNALLPYFTYLATDEWRRHRNDQWDSDPEAVRQSVRDYLVYRLQCKVRHHNTHNIVFLTAESPSTTRIFLSALKQFYSVTCRAKWYPYEHPLIDSVTQIMREVDLAPSDLQHSHHRRMPQVSGVEEPRSHRLSENYFRLAENEWVPHPIDDPELHKQLLSKFRQANLCLRDQIVIRMAYESGARIREILQLTIGDWRTRGCNQEAMTFSKGSRGRRVKFIRFYSVTAKMLREYINTERQSLDLRHRRLEQLDDADPLFLSARHKPYDYAAFIPNWKKLCRMAQIDLNIHGLRHWYVTQAIREIAQTATSAEEILLRKEELIRYMAWRRPETLRAYEHYFQAKSHARTQDQLLKRLYEGVEDHIKEHEKKTAQALTGKSLAPSRQATSNVEVKLEENGWADLLALGGTEHG